MKELPTELPEPPKIPYRNQLKMLKHAHQTAPSEEIKEQIEEQIEKLRKAIDEEESK